MSKRYAVISVGTNSARMLLADVTPEIPRVDAAGSIGTRLGEGLGTQGRLGDEPMRRTLDAVRQLYDRIRGHYVKLFAVTTSAMRRAENGEALSEKIQEILGVPMRVLTGEEEAEASYRGAIAALDDLRGDRVAVLDVGGGSTEYAAGTGIKPEDVVSCEIGAVRLTEAVPQLAGRDGTVDDAVVERARAMALAALEPMNGVAPPARIALVGGSATTAAAIARGRKGSIESYALTKSDLDRVLAQLRGLSLDDRKKIVGMRPQRADILPAGIIIIASALEALKLETATATTSDLLLGVMLQHRDAAVPLAGDARPAHAASPTQRGSRR